MRLAAVAGLDGSVRSRMPSARPYRAAACSTAPCRHRRLPRLFNDTAKSVVSGTRRSKMSAPSRSNGAAALKLSRARNTLPRAREAPRQDDAARREPPLNLDRVTQQRFSDGQVLAIELHRRLIDQCFGTAKPGGAGALSGRDDCAVALFGLGDVVLPLVESSLRLLHTGDRALDWPCVPRPSVLLW